jgi:hypothetical protein
MQMNLSGNNKGVSIIEILVVIVIINVVLVALLGLAAFSLKNSTFIKETSQADFLVQEAFEGVRNFRDGTDWDTDGLRALSGTYHLEKSGDVPPKWQLISGPETINGFTREIEFENVFRDGNDNISESGSPDPDTKKVTVAVSWKDKEVKIATYFTNWR